MNIVDSSGWLAYFADEPTARHFLAPLGDPSELVVPAITIYEVFKVILRESSEDDALLAAMAMQKGTVVDLTPSLAIAAARLSLECDLPMADSIILATAQEFDARRLDAGFGLQGHEERQILPREGPVKRAGGREVEAMGNWKSQLKADPTEWLLEEDNPSVRYLTLVDILEKSASDPEVKKARADIMLKGAVPLILAQQEEGGYWDQPDRMYLAKYKGTLWQLIILAEHLADGKDRRIRKACEFVLENSQDRESGGFSMHRAAKTGGGRHSEVIPCLTGNMVWSLIRLGYLKDPGVRRGIDWITTCQRFDDGVDRSPCGLALRQVRDVLGQAHLPHGRGQGPEGPLRDPASGQIRECPSHHRRGR